MIALWLPLWSLIGPDEGFVFLIIVFTFFITISLVVKFKSQINMSCIINNPNYVAQEQMALTKNPFLFRLSPSRPQTDEKSTENEEDKNVDRELEENDDQMNPTNEKSVDEKTEESVEKSDEDKSEKLKEINDTNDESKSDESKPAEINDFKKGIKIDVLCEEDYYLCYFWGVNIDQFHNSTRLNSLSFNEGLLNGFLFEQSFLEKREPKLIRGSKEIKTFKLTCSDKVTPETLGLSPRECYPLVVILARKFNIEEMNDDENDIMFMLNVVHVKDKVCPLETNVITRLLKKRNGLTINLQALYMPEFEDDAGSGEIAICVICQEIPVSIALLPCRHTCTCSNCFTKIQKCPLCRSFIRSYFTLKPREERETATSQQSSSQPEQTGEADSQSVTQSTGGASTSRYNHPNRNFFKKVGSKFTNLFK